MVTRIAEKVPVGIPAPDRCEFSEPLPNMVPANGMASEQSEGPSREEAAPYRC